MVANVDFSKTFVGGVAPTLDSEGDEINYVFSVQHLGGDPIADLRLSDPLLGLNNFDLLAAVTAGTLILSGDTNGNGVFEAGETWTFTEAPGSDLFTYVTTQEDYDSNGTNEPDPLIFGDFEGQIDNEARLLTFDANGAQQSASVETASVEIVTDPAIQVVKYTNGEDANSPTGPVIPIGDTVTWTYTVTNEGNVSLTNVVLVDDNGTPGDTSDDFNPTFTGGDTDGDGELDVDETWTYTASIPDAVAGQYTNIADVSGNFGQTVVTDDDPSNYFGADVQIAIRKETNGTDDECPDLLVGSEVTWTYYITNPGSVALSNVVVSDDNGTPGDTSDDFNPVYQSGDTNADGLLDTDETWLYSAVGVVQAGDYDNVATVNGDYVVSESISIAADEASEDDCYDGVTPLINIVKTTNGTDDECPLVLVGSTVTWGYTVTNPGDIALSDIVVVDDNGTPSDTSDDFNPTYVSGDDDGDGMLDTDETWIYEATGIATLGDYDNIATVTGTATDESENTAEVTASEDDCYEGYEEPEGPGVGTPGFWANNGARFWDGVVGNEGSKAGTLGFADGELLYAVDSNNDGLINGSDQVGLLIGDDGDGLTGAGEDTFFISLADARNLIKSGGSDGVQKIGRDAVASWLNYLAGNGIDNPGTGDDGVNPEHFINDAIDWLQVYGDASSSNVNLDENFDVYSSAHAKVNTSSAAWNSVLPFMDHSAAEIHSALDQYNNTGFIGAIQYANDRDAFFA